MKTALPPEVLESFFPATKPAGPVLEGWSKSWDVRKVILNLGTRQVAQSPSWGIARAMHTEQEVIREPGSRERQVHGRSQGQGSAVCLLAKF